MLHELVKYARRECPDSEPGFTPKEVRWAISLSGSGELLGLLPLRTTDAKNDRGKRFGRAPYSSHADHTSTKSQFLVEKLRIVAAYGSKEEVAKAEPKRNHFISSLKGASGSLPALSVAAHLLEDSQAMLRLRALLVENKAKSTDFATILIDGEFPLESAAWHDWWRAQYRSLTSQKSAGGEMVCLLTGIIAPPARTHDPIDGIPDMATGRPSRAVFVGFDKDAFQSYGLERSANAAVSMEAAKAYQMGLDNLIRHQSTKLGGVLVVHWYRSTIPAEDDPFRLIEDPPEVAEADACIRARKLLTAIREGTRPDLAGNTYYALSLSVCRARVMVRDWMEGAFEDLADAINAWFEDLAIVRPRGGGIVGPPQFFALRCALGRDPKDVPAPLAAKLFRVALRAEPIPFAVMAQALARARVDFIQESKLKDWEKARFAIRMGLLRAYFARKQRSEKGVTEMTETVRPELTEDLVSTAYQCGRLMAVLAGLQETALPDVKANIIQRYYAAASSTPHLVLGRLVRGAQFHLGKVKQDAPRLAWWYENRIAEICGRIGTSVPKTLTLEEQGLFALGYYQQLAALRARKENNKEEGEK
jgi:CRISPR-associated protein Csd1